MLPTLNKAKSQHYDILDTTCCYCKQCSYCEARERGSYNVPDVCPCENSAIVKLWHTYNITFLSFSSQSRSILSSNHRIYFKKNQPQASWEEVRVRSGTKSTTTRGKLSPRNTRTRRGAAQGAAVPSAACGRGTV